MVNVIRRWFSKFKCYTRLVIICIVFSLCTGFLVFYASFSYVLPNRRVVELTSADKYYRQGSSLEERLSAFPVRYSPYEYILNSDKCADDVTLLIGVCSAVAHSEQRRAIRNTWATWVNNVTINVRIIFVFGKTVNDMEQENLREESEQFGDIVQEDFLDTYYNLTLKSVLLLRWTLHYCPSVKYMMKTDDDMFVNVPNLAAYVNVISKPVHMFGHVIHGTRPDGERNRRYYKGDFPITEVYPDYLSGTGYVMSRQAVQRLFDTVLKEPLFFVEDVFITGICATRARIYREHHRGFHYEKRESEPCTFLSLVTAHHMTSREMRNMWDVVTSGNFTCTQQVDVINNSTLVILILILLTVFMLLASFILAQKY